MQLEKRKGMKIVWFENYSHYRCSEPSESGLVCISNQANQWGNWAPGATCARTLWQFKLGWLANAYKWGKTVWREIVVMENVLLQGIPRNAGHLIPTQPARFVQDNFKKKSCLWIVLSVLMLQFSPVNNSSRSAQCDSSILHTELPFFKPLLLVSCHFWPTSVQSSLDAYRHISFSTFVRPKNEPTTNQGTLKSPRAGIRWPKVEPGSPPKIKMLRRRRLPRFTQWVDNPFLFVKKTQ